MSVVCPRCNRTVPELVETIDGLVICQRCFYDGEDEETKS